MCRSFIAQLRFLTMYVIFVLFTGKGDGKKLFSENSIYKNLVKYIFIIKYCHFIDYICVPEFFH